VKFGKTRFYADENVELDLVDYFQSRGYRVESAHKLGLLSRDDHFHLQEAKRRKVVLLTRDVDFLNHREFPFRDLKNAAIVIMRTPFGLPVQAATPSFAALSVRSDSTPMAQTKPASSRASAVTILAVGLLLFERAQ